MTSRHNLPAEILCGIFNNLEPSDILQCQKVCKAWCAPVQTIIYTHVHLKNAEESTIVAYFATINANPSLEKLAKSLGFSKGYHRVYELLLDFGSVNTIFRNISKTENIKRLFESKAMGIYLFWQNLDTQPASPFRMSIRPCSQFFLWCSS